MADSVHEVIAAKRFVLLDADGKIRAQLGVLADGGAGLAVYDSDRSPRACLTVGGDGRVSFDLYDKADRPPEAVGVGGELRFADQGMKVRARLDLDADGSVALILLGADGKIIWSAP